ncbi:MAG: hypothetical protein IKW39_04165 [Alphaproteobacteria bacterium]|nr:hypothetical protein [Alphaproteobacteria bacterium]
MNNLCLVDENLKIVTTEKKAKAFANILNTDVVEIIFMTPLAHYLTRTEANIITTKWKERNYPQYQASLPEFKTCHFVNKNIPSNKSPMFADCHVQNSNNNHLTKLDSAGYPQKTAPNDLVMNVYGALLINISEFKYLNPEFNPEDYA